MLINFLLYLTTLQEIPTVASLPRNDIPDRLFADSAFRPPADKLQFPPQQKNRGTPDGVPRSFFTYRSIISRLKPQLAAMPATRPPTVWQRMAMPVR